MNTFRCARRERQRADDIQTDGPVLNIQRQFIDPELHRHGNVQRWHQRAVITTLEIESDALASELDATLTARADLGDAYVWRSIASSA
jgi:hypothetical protein